MPKRPQDDSFINFDFGQLPPDPAVTALLSSQERLDEARHETPEERRKRKVAEARRAERKARQTEYLIDEDLQEKIKRIAADLNVPESQVAQFLIEIGLGQVDSNQIDFHAFLAYTKSRRYDWQLLRPSAAKSETVEFPTARKKTRR